MFQRHDRKGDGSEKLDRRPQFETGLTGTPYAVILLDLISYFHGDRQKFQDGVKAI